MRIEALFRYRVVLAVLLSLFFQASFTTSCSLVRTVDTRELSLPVDGSPLNPEDGESVWFIRWLDGNGDVKYRYLTNPSAVLLEIHRESPVIVSACPVSDNTIFTPLPAGYLSGMPVETGLSMTLTWADGYAADYLLNLAAAGIDPREVNVDRLREAVRSRGGDNPWFLDTRRLSTDLIEGNLWIYSFRQKDRVAVFLPLQPGEWYSRYAPAEVMVAGNEGWSGFLPEGTHCFYNPVENLTVTATVDEEGRVVSLQG